MPDSPDTKRYDDEELARILRRAAELQELGGAVGWVAQEDGVERGRGPEPSPGPDHDTGTPGAAADPADRARGAAEA